MDDSINLRAISLTWILAIWPIAHISTWEQWVVTHTHITHTHTKEWGPTTKNTFKGLMFNPEDVDTYKMFLGKLIFNGILVLKFSARMPWSTLLSSVALPCRRSQLSTVIWQKNIFFLWIRVVDVSWMGTINHVQWYHFFHELNTNSSYFIDHF